MKAPAVSIARKLLRNSHFDFFFPFFLVVRYITTKCNIWGHHCFDVVQLQQMETNMVEQSSYVICVCIYKYIPINLLLDRVSVPPICLLAVTSLFIKTAIISDPHSEERNIYFRGV